MIIVNKVKTAGLTLESARVVSDQGLWNAVRQSRDEVIIDASMMDALHDEIPADLEYREQNVAVFEGQLVALPHPRGWEIGFTRWV